MSSQQASGRSSVKSQNSARSAATSAAIDPDQLLELCHQIKENLVKLDSSIRLARLRLTTLSYLGDQAQVTSSHAKCLEDLSELCQLSQSIVRQLDALQAKLNDDPLNLISYQIASQQLAYFTSEWYDNLTPKFNQTLELAEQYHLAPSADYAANRAAGNKRKWKLKPSRGQDPSSSAELRVREALARLRQSMSENEQLIASISNNLAYTKMTIETIYSSLRFAKIQLGQSDQNAAESIGLVRGSARTKIILQLVLIFVVALVVFVLLRLIGIV